MKTTIAISTAAIMALAAPAFAGAHTAEVQTKSGKTVWSLGDALPGGGANKGDKGKTAKAAGGLTIAAEKGGLNVVSVTPEE